MLASASTSLSSPTHGVTGEENTGAAEKGAGWWMDLISATATFSVPLAQLVGEAKRCVNGKLAYAVTVAGITDVTV